MEIVVQSSVGQYSKPFYSLARNRIMAASVPITRVKAMDRRREGISQLTSHSFFPAIRRIRAMHRSITSSPTGDTVSFATPEVGVSNTETREWAMQGEGVMIDEDGKTNVSGWRCDAERTHLIFVQSSAELFMFYGVFGSLCVGVFVLFYMATDFYTLRKDVETVLERVQEIRAAAGLKQLQEDLAALEAAAADSSLWDDRAKAQETLQALTDCKDKLKLLRDFKTQADDAETIVKLTEEMDSIDSVFLQEASGIIKELNKALDRFELTQLLSGPYDKEGAVITITAGAGGTDAQDWADMLLRMYVRWAEKQRYKTKVVEKSVGEEAGIKSATVEIDGRYAYGYLSGEKGTHRIVRQSPFNSKGLRQSQVGIKGEN
ncbi:hypothetical protein MTR67_018758 [Solanum verrucosum]|uniref:Peptide chain release factor domain-containing protein n=1 Tax=Solanum verrucosum TaxID=315347 RepID=A0AAF0TU19_SOLVR|nr:hypothetical protein MTR67_018758 [Solanum verrucosum]